MKNPFTIKVIPPDGPFCNREKEQKDLLSYAENKANLVLYSPRRFGKTSLVKRVQYQAFQKGMFTIYIDLFGLSSTDDIAARIAKSIYELLYIHKTIFQKTVKMFQSFRPVMRPTTDGVSMSVEVIPRDISGIDLLEKTMEDLGQFIKTSKSGVHIVLDEFQEITELKDTKIEGILRKHIQEHQASYFFVGSRRRILLEMFTTRKRPFFQSAFLYKLEALPEDELKQFLILHFKNAGKTCPEKVVSELTKIIDSHPYYAQKLAYTVCQTAQEEKIDSQSIQGAFTIMIDSEAPVFESIIQGLTPQQIALLKAISKEPSASVLSTSYMNKHQLKSIGGVQSALKKLTQMDLVEKMDNKTWKTVDPVFGRWLNRYAMF